MFSTMKRNPNMSKINSFRNCEREKKIGWLEASKQPAWAHQAVANRVTVGMISNNHKFQVYYFSSAAIWEREDEVSDVELCRKTRLRGIVKKLIYGAVSE